MFPLCMYKSTLLLGLSMFFVLVIERSYTYSLKMRGKLHLLIGVRSQANSLRILLSKCNNYSFLTFHDLHNFIIKFMFCSMMGKTFV